MIGREGVTGVNVLLGENRSPQGPYVQIAGQGLRANAQDLRDVLTNSESLRATLARYQNACSLTLR